MAVNHGLPAHLGMILAVNQSLKQGGHLVIVEFSEGHPFGPLDKAERMTEEQIRAEIEPAGFDLGRLNV